MEEDQVIVKSKTKLKREKRIQERREKRKECRMERKKTKKEERLLQQTTQNTVDTKADTLEKEHTNTGDTFRDKETDKPREKKMNFWQKRKKEGKEKCKNGTRVAIDLSFGDFMGGSEKSSLVNQIRHAYGKNIYSTNPFHMYLVGLGDPKLQQALERVQGYQSWEIEKENKTYLELFSSKEIVYLSPDSPNVLMEVDPTKAYIIGGLTDYKRSKNTTFSKASGEGIATAKLPLHLLNMDPEVVNILCVDHVFFSLLYFCECGDWIEALHKALPLRKTRTAKVLPSSSTNAHNAREPNPKDENTEQNNGEQQKKPTE